MTGASRPSLRKPDVGSLATTLRRRVALLVLPLAGLALVASACGFESAEPSNSSSASVPAVDSDASQSASPIASSATSACGGSVTPTPDEPSQINLVLDDSGSMFYNQDSSPDDAWSYAKYSVGVLAALMMPSDSMSVYLLSTFMKGPAVTVTGEDAQKRVDQIAAMQMNGLGTPYAGVEKAAQDLLASNTKDKWLVILTDGSIRNGSGGREPDVDNKLKAYGRQGINVIYLWLDKNDMGITNDPAARVFMYGAPSTDELIAKMTEISNRIFQRALAPTDGASTWAPDIDMSEVVVFAQGPGVGIGSATSVAGTASPSPLVGVKWSENREVYKRDSRTTIPAIPNKNLEGAVGTFAGEPAGKISFEVTKSQKTDVFYKPKVDFGYVTTDAQGKEIEQIDEGVPFALNYGFMDENCAVIESSLLGTVEYKATLRQGDTIIREGIKPEEVIDGLSCGDYTLTMTATYLDGRGTAEAVIDVTVPCVSFKLVPAADGSVGVSELGMPSMEGAVAFKWVKVYRGQEGPPSEEDLATLAGARLVAESESNLEWKLAAGKASGEVVAMPRAPEGDCCKADTGAIPVALSASGVEGANVTSEPATLTVVDDRSLWTKFWCWFVGIGWILLLLLLLLLIIIGYIIKPRFPRLQNNPPNVLCSPKRFGRPANNGFGRFNRSGWRRLLPYVADRATVLPWDTSDGNAFFVPLKLKAKRGKFAEVTNYKELAIRGEQAPYFVFVNGQQMDDAILRPPRLGRGAVIDSESPECTDSCTPF